MRYKSREQIMYNTVNKTTNEKLEDLIKLRFRDNDLVLYWHYLTVKDKWLEDIKSEYQGVSHV